MHRHRLTQEERRAMYQEALDRAQQNEALTNYPAIFEGFGARGIPGQDILPRENVFTFNAWKAKGRFVRRGERGVRVVTYVPMQVKERDTATGEEKEITIRRPKIAYVFHVSQTEPMLESKAV